MQVLWAVKIGEPDYYEQLITVQSDRIAEASEWAKANGFDRLRIADMPDEPEMPEFGANLLSNSTWPNQPERREMRKRIAWTPVINGDTITLGIATEGEHGYSPLQDNTGLVFKTWGEASKIAAEMNARMRISVWDAAEIVASSMVKA